MKTRKIASLMLMTLLVLALIPFTLAEELTDEEIAKSTEKEVSTMNTKHGAEVRLLQLEKSITRNILTGNEIISYLAEKNEDVSELETLVTELEALKLEVQSLNATSENTVETFVNIKQEAIEISKEFRETAGTMLNEEDRAEIANRISEINRRTDLQSYNEQIRNRVRSHNAERLTEVSKTLGIENKELIAKVENGEVNITEVQAEIRATLNEMTPEERQEALTTLKEQDVRKNIVTKQRIDKAGIQVKERQSTKLHWLEKASENIQNPARKERVQNKLEIRSTVVDNRADRISNRLEKREALI